MTKRLLTTVLMLAIPAIAETSITEVLVKHWKTTTDFTMAVANAMPAESYNFKPVPAELSFGQLIIQIGSANINACALASGMTKPAVPEKLNAAYKDEKIDVDKPTATQFLADTFAFCNQAVAAMTPDKLQATVGVGNRKMTGFEWLWSYFTHTAHHRGQAEVYLRIKGITPPTYVF